MCLFAKSNDKNASKQNIGKIPKTDPMDSKRILLEVTSKDEIIKIRLKGAINGATAKVFLITSLLEIRKAVNFFFSNILCINLN